MLTMMMMTMKGCIYFCYLYDLAHEDLSGIIGTFYTQTRVMFITLLIFFVEIFTYITIPKIYVEEFQLVNCKNLPQ